MSAGGFTAGIRAAIAEGSAVMPLIVPLMAVPFGLLAAAALWTFQAGVRHGSISTSWLLLNMSVVVPTGLSVALYGEAVSPKTAAALVLIGAAMVLVWRDRWKSESRLSREGGGDSCGSV